MALSQTYFHFVYFNVPSGFHIICISFKSNIVMTVIFDCMIHMPSLFVARFRNKSVLVYLLHSVYTSVKIIKSWNPEREVKQTTFGTFWWQFSVMWLCGITSCDCVASLHAHGRWLWNLLPTVVFWLRPWFAHGMWLNDWVSKLSRAVLKKRRCDLLINSVFQEKGNIFMCMSVTDISGLSSSVIM